MTERPGDEIQPPPAGHKPVIGLLGAPGSGKSYVARRFEALGCAVIDADVLAREALQEPAVRDRLVEWWGERVLDGAEGVDRRAVGRIVFNDREALAALEGLTHPRVGAKRRALRERYQADPAVVAIVEDSPLLMEKGLDAEVGVLVFVEAPWAERLARVRAERGWDEAELARREKNQSPLDTKRRRADYVVQNHKGVSDVLSQVRRVLFLILHRPDQSA